MRGHKRKVAAGSPRQARRHVTLDSPPLPLVKKPTTADKKATPYPSRTKLLDEDRQRVQRLSASLIADGKKPSSSTIAKHLLNTLSNSSNPITHSNIYQRSDTVVSATTGHQRGERRTPHGISAKAYFEDRSKKLSLQRKAEEPSGVLSNVRVYIDGYLSGTTDIEMKRIVTQAGGITLSVPSGATHIVTSRPLNGSKMHRILTTKSKNPVLVVKPEWVTDSIMAGRRLQESHYAVIKSCGTRNLVDMMKSGGPS